MWAGAAEGGQLAALQHLRSGGCDWNEGVIACAAARSGSIEVVEWLRHQESVEFGADALSCAASTGHVAMCAKLRGIGCDWSAEACRVAAVHGHYDTVR
jgi:hypothetical protein